MADTLEKVTGDQIDKALNDMDVLPSENQEVVRIDSERFAFTKVEYKLIENHKDAFDLEMMENRYTDYLLKYDYIVGDISYEKLRLRGFYDDHRRGVPIDMKISNLEDYLVEYCSFGCQYFVFERLEKDENDPKSYFKKKSNTRNERGNRSNQKQSNRQNKQRRNNKQNKNEQQSRNQNKKMNQQSNTQKDAQSFQVKKKNSKMQQQVDGNQQTRQNSQTNKNQQTKNKGKEKVSFKIRKKTD